MTAPAWFGASAGAFVRTKRRPEPPAWFAASSGQITQISELDFRADCSSVPTAGVIASPFGQRRSIQDPTQQRQHQGVDFAGALGDEVWAIADGIVEHATVNGARGFGCYGHVLVLHHPQLRGVRSFYAHLSELAVRAGDRVRAGQRVASVGNTNGSEAHPGTTFADGACLPGGQFRTGAGGSGPHLHFEMAPRRYPMAYDAPRFDPIVELGGIGISYTENARGGRPLRLTQCGPEDIARADAPAIPATYEREPLEQGDVEDGASASMIGGAIVAIGTLLTVATLAGAKRGGRL